MSAGNRVAAVQGCPAPSPQGRVVQRAESRRRGIGTGLTTLAKGASPPGPALWRFQADAAARTFCARQRGRAARRTAGDGNAESLPGILPAWGGHG